jgi:hypothetical protein
LDNQHNQRNYEQDMDESAQGVGADQSEQPEHEQDHKYCPKHKIPFGSLCLLRAKGFRCAYRSQIKNIELVASAAVAIGLSLV